MIVGKMVLLIVDDMEVNREILKAIWADDSKYEMLEAGNGIEALAILDKRRDVSLILLDIVMPKMGGLELLTCLKDNRKFSKIPVILNTQGDEREHEEKGLRLGADDFIFKPYVAGVIRKRVENVIKKNIYERDRKDGLTGIYNSETFYSQTRRLLFENIRDEFVLVRFNITKFKFVNELFGIRTGDKVLIKMAQAISKAVDDDGIYARLEADHFVCCMPVRKCGEDGSFFKRLTEEIQKIEKEYSLFIQCGVYVIKDRSLPVSVMCDRANMASQEIKGNYVSRFAYYEDKLGERYLEEQKLIREMDKALSEGQFYIELQPIYDAIAEKPTSAEALVRWKHPEKGIISPGVFIPLFERSGLITRLDAFVWEEVCKILATLKKRHQLVYPISINISRVDFMDSMLINTLNYLVEQYKLEKEWLKLEVTESAYADNPQEIIRQVIEFRREGFEVMMDDFGSGYSSLNALKELPVNILKIDMKFMDNLENSARAGNIVMSIIKMAKLLGMKTIAEGVETRTQVDFLKNVGCDRIQGYYFSRPLQVESFMQLVEQEINTLEEVGTAILKKGILIVCDKQMSREVIKNLLGNNYIYYEVNDGKAALKRLRELTFAINLVITAVTLPVMDGSELITEMQKKRVYARIPILAYSMEEDTDKEVEVLRLGAVDIIRKGYNTDIVRQKIINILKLWDIK